MLRTSAAPVCRHRVSDPVHQKFLPSAPGQHWEWMACQDLASAVLTLQKHQTQFNCLQICSAFFWCCRCFCSFAFTILYLIEIYGMDLPYNNHCPGLLRKGFSHTPVPPDQWTCVDPALRAFSFSDRENIISRKHHMIYGFKWECLRDIPPYQEKKLIMCWAGLQNWRLLISVPSQSQLPAAASLVPSSQRRSSENALPGRSPNKTLNAAVPPNIFSQFAMQACSKAWTISDVLRGFTPFDFMDSWTPGLRLKRYELFQEHNTKVAFKSLQVKVLGKRRVSHDFLAQKETWLGTVPKTVEHLFEAFAHCYLMLSFPSSTAQQFPAKPKRPSSSQLRMERGTMEVPSIFLCSKVETLCITNRTCKLFRYSL